MHEPFSIGGLILLAMVVGVGLPKPYGMYAIVEIPISSHSYHTVNPPNLLLYYHLEIMLPIILPYVLHILGCHMPYRIPKHPYKVKIHNAHSQNSNVYFWVYSLFTRFSPTNANRRLNSHSSKSTVSHTKPMD